MKIDWYQATIDHPPRVIVEACLASLPGATKVNDQPFGGNGYRKSSLVLNAAGDTIATLLHGSSTASPNLRGTGHRAAPIAHLIRSTWPIHRVSRIDVCEDMTNPGLYRQCERIMRKVALKAGIETGLSMIPDIAVKGRTYRLGGNKSDTIVRLYEKGLEQLGKGLVTDKTVDKNLVRLEIQHRPRRPDGKALMATVEPPMIWGVSNWTKELAMHIMKLDVPRIMLQAAKQSDWDVTELHHVMQYSQHMIDGGERIAGADLGLVEPCLEDSIDAYLEQLRPVLLAFARRKGASAISLRSHDKLELFGNA